ncbi:lipoprotein [Mesoplasma whartonense]|uniref:lipoprotein n=1 Tax=Mesoplasma whartonense TaxID=2878854 RepID=UPI002022A61C|nr:MULTISPECIES: lipoprotein [unclassified Mesoplasma]MCL8212615.1 hypothetical protein [Mesoplasma sp. JKS002661]MCL8216227.1 hypothetical protein [Mesoplasma sp. JKS002657]
MRKLLTILGAVGLTATSTATVVACGDGNKNPVPETIELGSVQGLDKTITGSEEMTAATALNAFLAIDANKDLEDQVQVKEGEENFVAPTTEAAGKLVIIAKTDSTKYTGELTVTIDYKADTIDLGSVQGLNKTITGSEEMTAATALNAFLAIDANKDLEDQVQVKEGEENFVAPTTEAAGKLVIVAKTDSTKYTGELEIIISALSGSQE